MCFPLIPGWFGMRKNFSQFLLCALPFLQEYGNISYHAEQQPVQPSSNNRRSDGSSDSSGRDGPDATAQLDEFSVKHERRSKKYNNKKIDHLKPVVPIISIDLPD